MKIMRIDYKNKKLIDQEVIDQKEIDFAVEETSLNLQQDIVATKRELEKAKMRLEIAKSTYPLDVDAHIEAKNDVYSCETGLADLEQLKKELGF